MSETSCKSSSYSRVKETFFPSKLRSQKDPEKIEQEIDYDVIDKFDKVQNKHWYDAFIRLFWWYPSTLPKDEKKLLFKVDVILLLYVCSSYFTKSLDKSNLVKAYNSGMDVSIGFTGNDYAYARSLYSAGYIISMCVGMMIVTRPWARFSLPILETVWGVLTFCEGVVKNSSQMFALRFLIGLAEGPIFPMVVYTIGSWYKRDELFRRVMCFSISSTIGGIFSGFLQSAAFHNLGGKGGYEGWQWGFFIDGIVTVPIALFGFIVYPGSLDQAKNVWWLKKSELSLAVSRMTQSGVRQTTKMKLSWSLIKRFVYRWHAHYFAAYWVLLNVSALPDGTGFDLWLKAHSDVYDETARTNYPSFQGVFGIVMQFIFAGLSDSFSPYIFLTIAQLLFIVSFSSLVYWDIPLGWRWVCFILQGLSSVNQALISGQINRVVRRDAEERAFVIGYSDSMSQAMNVWTNIVFFPTSKAPEFRLGYKICLVGSILMLLMPIGLYRLEQWDREHYAKEDLEFIKAKVPSVPEENPPAEKLESIIVSSARNSSDVSTVNNNSK